MTSDTADPATPTTAAGTPAEVADPHEEMGGIEPKTLMLIASLLIAVVALLLGTIALGPVVPFYFALIATPAFFAILLGTVLR